MNPFQRAKAAYQKDTPLSDDELVRTHSRLIERLANQISTRARSRELAGDLWSVGALALIEAARRFEASRGVKFETFVEHRVRGAMLDELRKMDHLPRRLRTEAGKVATSRRTLTTKLGRPATSEEVADELGLSLDELQETEALSQPLLPLVDPEALGSSNDPSPQDLLIRRRLGEDLTAALGALPERQRLVMSLYYMEGFTYKEIAAALSVSEPRICQVHREAIETLREALVEHRATA